MNLHKKKRREENRRKGNRGGRVSEEVYLILSCGHRERVLMCVSGYGRM